MIAIAANMEVQPGKEAEFEAEFRTLVATVREKEPGVKLYQLTRSKRSPQSYVMLELYADAETLKAHSATDYFAASFGRIKTMLAAEPVFEMLETVD